MLNLFDLTNCGNRLDTGQDLNGKVLFVWGPDVGIGDWSNMMVGFKMLKERFPFLKLGVVYGQKVDVAFLYLCRSIDYFVPVSQLGNLSYPIDVGLNIQIDDDTLWHHADGTDSTTIERQLTELGLPLVESYSPDFDLPPFCLENMTEEMVVADLKPSKFVIHHCGATNPGLRWPHEYVKSFARIIYEAIGYPTAVIGYSAEWGHGNSDGLVDLTGRYSIVENIAIMITSGWFVGGHSSFNCIGGGLPIKMISMYAYMRHYYMWSGFYKNSYDLVPHQSVGDIHLEKHSPEKVADIFLKLVRNKIKLPYLEILRWRQ